MVKVTALPDAPPLALGVYVSPNIGFAGGVEVNLMAWRAGLIVRSAGLPAANV
jgi:hypothetical protein